VITANNSPLRRQVAELVVVRASGHASDHQRRYPRWEQSNKKLQRLLSDGVGGVILLGGTTTELISRCKNLRQWAQAPLLICADVEEGVGQRFEGGTWLVPPLALGQLFQKEPERAVALAERYGRCTGQQAKSCGLNWVLAPVCDINNNPANPVINVRAWGEDPQTVAELICAFERGLCSAGILGCAKHFPGHGDTETDSHLELPIVGHNQERLNNEELVPFRAAIASGIESVMTAHLLIQCLDQQRPATLSAAVLKHLLRDELNFQGLIVTDALVMESISRSHGSGEAAVMAFEAGADLILMPEDADEAIDAICAAITSGRIGLPQLNAARQRRHLALEKVNNNSQATNTLQVSNEKTSELESEADRILARELVEASLQVRHPKSIQSVDSGINLLRVDSLLPCPMLAADAPALTLPSSSNFQPLICHNLGLSPWQPNPKHPLALERLGDGSILLQLFLRGNPFKGRKDASEPWTEAVQQLQRDSRLAGLIVYGSPYLWEQLQQVLDADIPAAYSPGQMPEAQLQALNALLATNEPQPATGPTKFNEFTD